DDDFAGVVHRRHAQRRTLLRTEELPGNDVRVMLNRGDEDLITPAEILPAPGLRDEVDAFRRPPREDDFLLALRVQEALDRRARAFIGGSGDLAEVVHAAMHIRVLFAVVARQTIDHLLRLLRRSGVVEIDELAAADAALKNRKIAADAIDVVRHGM